MGSTENFPKCFPWGLIRVIGPPHEFCIRGPAKGQLLRDFSDEGIAVLFIKLDVSTSVNKHNNETRCGFYLSDEMKNIHVHLKG